MTVDPLGGEWKLLVEELENFQSIARFLKPPPGAIPVLDGVEIAGESIPLNGVLGGDHVLYIDFNRRYDLDARIRRAESEGDHGVADALRRNKQRAGILVADVAGHRITDALLAAMLHQAFLLGSYYELDSFGTITTKIFENINARFFEASAVNKYIAMIYGEIADSGHFRFISAAHPKPIVFSRAFRRIVGLPGDRLAASVPIGMFRSQDDFDRATGGDAVPYKTRFTVNEIRLLGSGDILILHTDGFSEHGQGRWLDAELEGVLREADGRGAGEIAARLRESLLAFAPPDDDITFVVVRKL